MNLNDKIELENPEILIINGSPRNNKNCGTIASEIKFKLDKKGLRSKIFNIYNMDIEYCTACGFCNKTGYCKFNDEMTPMYKYFDNSKGTIVISPVYFDSISAKVKTFVDRTQAIYASKYILKKSSIDRSKKRTGMYIAVGGSDSYDSQFKGGQVVMDFFFKSINTKLLHNIYLNGTDNVAYVDNEEFKSIINKNLEEYINSI